MKAGTETFDCFSRVCDQLLFQTLLSSITVNHSSIIVQLEVLFRIPPVMYIYTKWTYNVLWRFPFFVSPILYFGCDWIKEVYKRLIKMFSQEQFLIKSVKNTFTERVQETSKNAVSYRV